MRSPVWFVVAGLIALAGFAGALFYVMPRLAAVDAGMIRVVVPGSAVLTLDKAGSTRSTMRRRARWMAATMRPRP